LSLDKEELVKKKKCEPETKQDARRRLEKEAQRLRELQVNAEKSADRMSAIYREMSNLYPHAFVVVVRDGQNPKLDIHGLSHDVSRGIEFEGMSFKMYKPVMTKEREYLLINCPGDGGLGLMTRLDPGKKIEVWTPFGNAAFYFTVYFTLQKKNALAFARKMRKQWAKGK
jgi:hypothetical protein